MLPAVQGGKGGIGEAGSVKCLGQRRRFGMVVNERFDGSSGSYGDVFLLSV